MKKGWIIAIIVIIFLCLFGSCSTDETDEIMGGIDWGDSHYYDSIDNQVKKIPWK